MLISQTQASLISIHSLCTDFKHYAFFLFLLCVSLTLKDVAGNALQEEYPSLALIEEYIYDENDTSKEETTTEEETSPSESTTSTSTITSTSSDISSSQSRSTKESQSTASNTEDGDEYVFSHSARKAGLASFFSLLSLTIIGSVTYCFCKRRRQSGNYRQSSIYQREPPQINLTLD